MKLKYSRSANLAEVTDARPSYDGFGFALRHYGAPTGELVSVVATGPRGGEYPDETGIVLDRDGRKELIRALLETL